MSGKVTINGKSHNLILSRKDVWACIEIMGFKVHESKEGKYILDPKSKDGGKMGLRLVYDSAGAYPEPYTMSGHLAGAFSERMRGVIDGMVASSAIEKSGEE